MRDSIRRLLVQRTGADVPAWNARIRKTGIADSEKLRAWLTREGVTGYPRMLLVMERFGYPEFMTASADQLIDGQYVGTPNLRRVYDSLVRRTASLGEVVVQARKTYVSLCTPRRTFARIKRVSRDSVAVALRLEVNPGGRLSSSKIHDSMPVELVFHTPKEIDAEAMRWIARALHEST